MRRLNNMRNNYDRNEILMLLAFYVIGLEGNFQFQNYYQKAKQLDCAL